MKRRHPRDHARLTPDKPAIVLVNGGSRSYAELVVGADRLRALFSAHGLRRGDCVAQLMENGLYFCDALWAAHDGGLYFTPLSTLFTAPELGHILRDSGARLLVTSIRMEGLAREAAASAPGIERVVVLDGADAETLARQPAVEPGAEALQGGLLLYSSGTTGQPKGIKPKLRDVPPDVPPDLTQILIKLYEIDARTVYLSPAPLYHAAPMKWTLTVQVAGGTCVIMSRFDAAEALKAMCEHSVTHSQWVPTMMQRLLRLPEADRKVLLSSHRFAVHAAAPCPPSVKRAMIDWWGPILHEYYAGTESNGLTALNSAEWLAHPGSVGRSLRGDLHIMADNGETGLAPGEAGLIYFAGGTPFEYHDDPEKTAGSRNSRGWTTIGDVGYVDEDGYLYLTDRRDDVIISGGVNIYPQEIEKLLAAHPAVADVAVLGVPNADYGEEVKALVQLATPLADAPAQLASWLAPQLASYKRPRSWEFVEALPRLPTGKLLKRVLRDRYWSGAGAPSAITRNEDAPGS